MKVTILHGCFFTLFKLHKGTKSRNTIQCWRLRIKTIDWFAMVKVSHKETKMTSFRSFWSLLKRFTIISRTHSDLQSFQSITFFVKFEHYLMEGKRLFLVGKGLILGLQNCQFGRAYKYNLKINFAFRIYFGKTFMFKWLSWTGKDPDGSF